MSKNDDYYEPVVRGLRNIEGNEEAISHFFESTEPQEQTPTHSRAMDTDKAIAVAGEFLHNVHLSILTNGKRQWRPEPSTALPSAKALEQPLDYLHSSDLDKTEF